MFFVSFILPGRLNTFIEDNHISIRKLIWEERPNFFINSRLRWRSFSRLACLLSAASCRLPLASTVFPRLSSLAPGPFASY